MRFRLPKLPLRRPSDAKSDSLRNSAGPPPVNPTLPEFEYFACDALKKVCEPSSESCDCCGQRRGFLYRGPFYHPGPHPGPDICPNCIKDGSAAAKYNGSFNDIVVEFDGEVIDEEAAKVPAEIIDQLLHRTPGYSTWQGNQWIFHAGDGGVFQGDATAEVVANASAETIAHFDAINGSNTWAEFIEGFTPDGSISVYHFKSRVSDIDLFLWDHD